MDWGGLPGWIIVGTAAVVFGGLLAFGWRLLRRVRRDGPALHRTVALIEVNVGVLGLIACVAGTTWLGFEYRRRSINPRGKTAAQLVGLLGDRDPRVRLNACSWCKPPGRADIIVPGLIGALADDSQKVRLAAMKCLAMWKFDAAAAAPDLARCLAADPKSKDAAQAFYTLKRLGPAAAAALEPLLAHPSDPVRDAALAALVKLEPLPVGVFERQLDSAEGPALRSVLRAMARATEAAADAVARLRLALARQVAARPDPRERWQCAWALWALDAAAVTTPDLADPIAAALDTLLADTATGEAAWQARACRLLGALPAHAEHSVPVLVAALQDERTANAACAALQALGPLGRPAIPALVAQLRIGRGRAQAIPALATMGPAAADAVRAALAEVADDAMRREVLEAALDTITDAIAHGGE